MQQATQLFDRLLVAGVAAQRGLLGDNRFFKTSQLGQHQTEAVVNFSACGTPLAGLAVRLQRFRQPPQSLSTAPIFTGFHFVRSVNGRLPVRGDSVFIALLDDQNVAQIGIRRPHNRACCGWPDE